MFQKIRDDHLMDAYMKSIELNLDPHFIFLIEKELSKRGLYPIQNQRVKSSTRAVKRFSDRYEKK
ncbi:sporulation histidine kinase inhibitor Sda [Metabacillus halosaccharovorans]|uniref:sporulation histidine kinase inhibitor Sda n=1 Tax=Metabacillus halosaccharovorans TaxID=930124 RepID=UPI00203E624B|nr:sporulation histidine kinase inhibitor Sda [Metabacillus halosaccharovorans]MCM3440216.1 sporulation histidine kinase inhibitor Sda [Metabacillus halosaccharovorans]